MIGVKGSFTGVLRHADGTEEIVKKDNLVLSAGYDLIFDRLFQIQAGEQYNSNKALQYIAVGTGTNAPAAEQTKLTTFLAANNAQYFHTAGTKECKLVATFGTGQAIGAITEAAVCYRNGTSAIDNNTHVAFDRVVFPAINKGREDVYTCTFKFVFGELKE
jgi:hypothetical protein